MRAKRKAGLPVPWAYQRAVLAQRWCVPPWVVDQASRGEINEALLIMHLEATCQPPEPARPAR